ncbi:MAG: hypothetical protein R3F20_01550 [Planctomycetota bacterium]
MGGESSSEAIAGDSSSVSRSASICAFRAFAAAIFFFASSTAWASRSASSRSARFLSSSVGGATWRKARMRLACASVSEDMWFATSTPWFIASAMMSLEVTSNSLASM